MKALVEMIGKRNGISVIDIHNQYESIDNNIKKLVEAGISGKEFIELMNKYKSLEYKYKQEFAKEIDPERYYMYY